MNTRSWLSLGLSLGLTGLAGYASSGCGDDIDPPYRVNTLRVMAVSASRPYVHPGETVTLRALQYDPRGRAIQWAWLPCPEAWLTDYRSCVEHLPAPADYRAWIQYTSTPSVTFTLPAIPFAESKAGKVSPMSYVIMGFACAGQVGLGESLDPVSGPFRCLGPNGEPLGQDSYVPGVKILGVHPTLENTNPSLVEPLRNDATWLEETIPEVDGCGGPKNDQVRCTAQTRQKLTVQVADGSFETGPNLRGDVEREVITVQLYVSEGTLGEDRRRFERGDPAWETGWWPQHTGVVHDAHLWIVGIDGRGGLTWSHRAVRVR